MAISGTGKKKLLNMPSLRNYSNFFSIVIQLNYVFNITLIENLIRDNLSPIEEAKAYMNRWKLMGDQKLSNYTESKVALKISKEILPSYLKVYTALCLLKLPQ